MGDVAIGTEHLLLALIIEGRGVASKALGDLGVSEGSVRVILSEGTHAGDDRGGYIPFSPRVKKVIELSLREGLQLGHNYIGTEHLLLAMVREGQGAGVRILAKLGVSPAQVREAVMKALSGYVTLLPEQFLQDQEAEGLAVLVISGVLAGEHALASSVVKSLRELGWRPPEKA